ncbi:hypothetical protein [Clostridium diolis]|uniref:Uncharacterized protein n=1 Tax=Clostridium diolis TaxID=223919 RepID=A0AAV3VTS4_9CLOT|nr:hypothetical protein [Clostridium diolis]QES75419.1 hypothetical protein F3K33_22495 [Clostridium diolis]GEA29410.1 hypothetical protein CDIOL_03330 [Clostridium diolis]
MIEVNLTRFLTGVATKKLTKDTVKKKGARDDDGNLILRESKITSILAVILFIVMFSALTFLAITATDIEDRNTFIAVNVMFSILFIILAIYLKISKKVITEDSIISQGLFFKKVIKFNLIESIECKSTGNNVRLILKGNGKKIIVPAMLIGFNEFFEILEKRVGQEKCRMAKLTIESFIK